MYKTIYIPVDNSDHSNTAVDVGVELAKTYGSKIVGSHVYAAKMHDKRFKQMEAGLPEEYHDEKELDRQRQIHDSLITRGLQIITDSYLDYVDKKCTEANLPVERRSSRHTARPAHGTRRHGRWPRSVEGFGPRAPGRRPPGRIARTRRWSPKRFR